MKLSIIIPAHNEEESLKETLFTIEEVLLTKNIDYEIIVINDNSKDNTEKLLKDICMERENIRYYSNKGPKGYGYAVRLGLDKIKGDCVAIMMADLSDSPHDLINFYKEMVEKQVDCVFGTRWSKGGKVIDYPFIKKIINRTANYIIRVVMNIKYNDTTNAFKLYRREVIDGVTPLLSPHFNLTIELPLKAIIRGYSYVILPNTWTNRKYGVSKLKIKEMGSRYFFILMYCFIEKYFSRGDFHRKIIL